MQKSSGRKKLLNKCNTLGTSSKGVFSRIRFDG